MILIIGGGAAAYMTGALDSVSGGEEQADVAHGGEGEAGDGHGAPAATGAVFFDLPEMLVNLNTGTNQASYLKIKVALELDSEASVEHVKALEPRLVDAFQVYLRELRLEDLNGAAGVYRLKEELMARVNAAVQPVKVQDILFKQMLVQ